ncbi:hypothetical protein AVEN_127689-1 [Araneus ventricosus]|uniref:Uncharacterized protein n=1 Tax=Araneus ventricosus TaxID=182803 RepID=A0A4Y2WP20_ARAVE|nr:hypothetical protein AVEN_127689-1 [Araneus ventricosus]
MVDRTLGATPCYSRVAFCKRVSFEWRPRESRFSPGKARQSHCTSSYLCQVVKDVSPSACIRMNREEKRETAAAC